MIHINQRLSIKWHFLSHDLQPYWFSQTKDNFCIQVELNSQRNGLVLQHGQRIPKDSSSVVPENVGDSVSKAKNFMEMH